MRQEVEKKRRREEEMKRRTKAEETRRRDNEAVGGPYQRVKTVGDEGEQTNPTKKRRQNTVGEGPEVTGRPPGKGCAEIKENKIGFKERGLMNPR